MTNRMQDSAAWLIGQLQNAAGRSITYSRAGVSSSTISAIVTVREYTIVDQDGFTTTVTVFDWSVDPSDIAIAGEVVTPRRGDLIEETLGSETITYEVLPLGQRPCYEWADTAGEIGIIHTKRVDVR